MILIAFNVSHTQNTKGHSGSEKHTRTLHKFLFPKCASLDLSIMQGLYNMSIEQTLSKSKTNRTETRF